MLNADEYKQVHGQMYDNWNEHVALHPEMYDASSMLSSPAYITADTGVNTDWQDAMTRSGHTQNSMLGTRGEMPYISLI